MQNDEYGTPDRTYDTPFINRFLAIGCATGNNAWWAYIVVLASMVVFSVVFSGVIYVPLRMLALDNGADPGLLTSKPDVLFYTDITGLGKSALLAIMLGSFAVLLPAFFLLLKYVQQKPWRSVVTAFSRVRWGRYLFAFCTTAVLLLLLTAVDYLVNPGTMIYQFEPVRFLGLLAVALVLIPVQTAFEEVVFRGYLMQGIGMLFRNGIVAIVGSALLFALMHSFNPEIQAHGFFTMMPYYVFLGLFLGVLTLLDEGAELAMGIHCAFNLVACLLVTSTNSALQTDAIFRTDHENITMSYLQVGILVVLCFVVLYRKYHLANGKLLLR